MNMIIHLVMQQTSEWLLVPGTGLDTWEIQRLKPYALGLQVLTVRSRGGRHKQTLGITTVVVAHPNHSDCTREKEPLGLQVGERA